jgi:hypothetical protein
MRTTRSPVERLPPSLLHVYRCCIVAPLCWKRCGARGELCQCLDCVLRLRWTRAIRRRGVVWEANVVLLGRLHVSDGGQRGLALVGGRVVAFALLLGGVVLRRRRVGFGVGIEQRRKARHGDGGRRMARCYLRIADWVDGSYIDEATVV